MDPNINAGPSEPRELIVVYEFEDGAQILRPIADLRLLAELRTEMLNCATTYLIGDPNKRGAFTDYASLEWKLKQAVKRDIQFQNAAVFLIREPDGNLLRGSLVFTLPGNDIGIDRLMVSPDLNRTIPWVIPFLFESIPTTEQRKKQLIIEWLGGGSLIVKEGNITRGMTSDEWLEQNSVAGSASWNIDLYTLIGEQPPWMWPHEEFVEFITEMDAEGYP